ncbi:MAG: hypothetical protein ACJAZX_001660 [Rickettsiales bacterium]|jgi:hypothetical protein
MQDQINYDHINYDEIIEDSMRTIINKVLKKVEQGGLHGNHHFVVTFSTINSGTILPDSLKKRFPSEMTIVIQHQFNSLKVEDDFFSISLGFSGILEKLTIPYRAISAFADPSVNFGLKFNVIDAENLDEDSSDILGRDSESKKSVNVDSSNKIVSLADFRKNHNKNK